ATIVLEDLKHIRAGTKQRGARQRRRMHSWAFDRLKKLVTEKAEADGKAVVLIDPRHTSQRCNCRGRVDKKSRKTQALFVCTACGFTLNADFNASRNIVWKHRAAGGITARGRPPAVDPTGRQPAHGGG